jgi:hypothetical protein
MSQQKCGVLECHRNRMEGRYVCELCAPLFDRIKAEIASNTYKNMSITGPKKKRRRKVDIIEELQSEYDPDIEL